MQTKRLMSLLCLFAFVVLFSSVAGAAPAAAPVPTVTAPPAQCPTAPATAAMATPDFFKPAAPDTGVPEWQPMVGCSLSFCNRCTQDGGICQYTGGHCVCI